MPAREKDADGDEGFRRIATFPTIGLLAVKPRRTRRCSLKSGFAVQITNGTQQSTAKMSTTRTTTSQASLLPATSSTADCADTLEEVKSWPGG